MNENDFAENTLTDAQASAIIEAYRFTFPDFLSDSREPYVKREVFRDKDKLHKCLFIFGNLIYFDSVRNCFVIRKIADGLNELGEFYMTEDSTHKDIQGVIKRILQRQLDFRLGVFFDNEVNDDGVEIPFSSRFECAVHGRKHKEYGCD